MWAMGASTRSYLYYLVHPQLDGEQYLRNIIFVIMATSLMEAASEPLNRHGGIRRDAQQLGLVGVSKHLDFWKAYCDGIAHTFSAISIEEMVFVQRLRDQAVHGRMTGHQDFYRPYVLIDGSITKGRMQLEEVDRTVETLCREHGGFHPAACHIRAKYSKHMSFFWTMVGITNMPTYEELLRREIYENRTDLIAIRLVNDCFMDTNTQLFGQDGLLWRLIDQRPLVANNPPSLADPLFSEYAPPAS
jgi:hypothetical protein